MQRFKLTPMAAVLVASVAAGPVAFAQQAQPSAPQKVEKIEITGSNIKRVDTEGPSPVLVLTKADIEKDGATNVADLLRNLPVNNVGQFAESTLGGNSFAPGTAAVSLRGLGANTTLVLLNGRRLANYGFGQNITTAFVDLNSIPLSAIERIEILKDGASAIYGSDAIAGVINIILRKDFKGVEVSGSYGEASKGDSEQQRYALTAGMGDLAKDRFNVMGVLDYYKREATWAKDREFSRTADQRANGGFDLRSPTGNPGTWLTNGRGGFTDHTVFPACPTIDRGLSGGLSTCFFNFQPYIYLLPPSERKGAFAKGTFEISPTLTAFAEYSYNKNETENSAAPTPATTTLPVGHNSNPYPFAVTIRYRFIDVGPRESTITTETNRFVAGVKGIVGSWDWEAAYNKGTSETANMQRGYVSQTALNTLTSNGVYNYVNNSANSAALVDSLRAFPFRIAKSTVEAFDAKASSEIFQMPGGPMGLAVGVEHRKEDVTDQIDPLSAQGLIVGSGGATANGARKLTSLFAELSVPLIKNLEMQLAVRNEDYSDFGKATKPKVAFSWKPVKDLMLRASYTEGFRAPSLAELYLGQALSFPSFIDTPRCTAYRAAFGNSDPRSNSVCGSVQVRTVSQGNSALRPEESESYGVGIVWEPLKDLSISLDYYNIKHTDRINQPSITYQLSNANQFPGTVLRNPQNATDILANAPGLLLGVASDTNVGLIRKYQNLAQQETEGLDMDLRYKMSIGDLGRLSFVSLTSYIDSFKSTTIPGGVLTEQVGSYQFPRTVTTNSVNWTKGSWDVGLTMRSRSEFRQNNQLVFQKVARFTTLDAQVQYTGLKGWRLILGANNVADKKPPFSDNENDGYANSTDNPVGRYIYGRFVYAFK